MSVMRRQANMSGMDTGEVTIPPKLYRVGELSQHTGLSRQTIHNYTTMGLIREADWTPGGHRVYDASVFARLAQIVKLKRSKSMQEIRHILAKQESGA